MRRLFRGALAALLLLGAGCASVPGSGSRGAGGPVDALLVRGDVREAEAATAALVARSPKDPWGRLASALLARRALDPAAEASALVALADGAPRHPLAFVALRRLAELAEESPEVARAIDAGLAPPLAAGRFAGVAAYRARVARVAAAEVLGEVERVAALRAENGAIRAWTLAGPFGRRRALDFVARWPAESGVLPESVPAPFGGPVRPTRAIPAPDGSLSLEGEPPGGDVFVLASDVTLARGGRYLVSVGTAMSARVTVDGALVHERRDFSAHLPTVVHVPVALGRGVHRVVVKVARTGERGTLHLALAREDGGPSDAIAAVVAPGAPAPAADAPDLGAPVLSARALADALASDAGVAVAALLAGMDAANVDREGAKALLAEAEAGLPASAAVRAVRGLLVSADPTLDEQVALARGEALLRDALARDPGHAAARLALASMLRRAGRLDEAEEVLAAAPAGVGGGAPARQAHLALARARLAEARGFVEVAERDVAEAIAGGAGCRALELGRDLAGRRRAVAVEDERARAHAACRDGRERLADHLRRRGDPAGAAATLAPLVAARPWAIEPTLALADAHVAAGDPKAAVLALEPLRAIWPRSARVEKRLADALELAGDAAGARAARERALLDDGGDLPLRRRLALDDGHEVLDDLAEDAAAAIRAYEAARRTDDTSSAMVLDAGAVELHPGGAYTERVHQVIHVLDPQGVERHGELSLPPGAEVIAARTVKPDGRTLEPERVLRDGKGTISLAGLEPGDYVRLEWVRSQRGLGATVAADPFYFRADGERLFLSRYVVAAPAGLGLAVDAHGTPAPEPVREGAREVVRAEARDVPAHVREPNQPPMGEFLPYVQVGLAGDRAEVQADLADVFAPAVRQTEELRAYARAIRAAAGKDAGPAALARAAWARIAREILGSGDDALQASESLSRGRGNRLLVLQAVLAELGVRSRVALARPFASDATPRRFAGHMTWPHALLRIEAGGETIWHDPSYRLAPLGTLPATVLGVEAIVLPVPGEPLEVVLTPERGAIEDRRTVAVRIALRPDGGADLEGEERYEGAAAAAAKASLERLDEADRRQALEAMLARAFRGLALASAELIGEADPAAPLVLRWRGAVQALARTANGGLVLDAPILPARLAPRYTQLAARHTPLLVGSPDRTTQRIEIVAPEGFTVSPDAPATVDAPFGAFSRQERAEGRTLVREERLELSRGRVPPERYAEFAGFAAAVDQVQQRGALFPRVAVPGGASPVPGGMPAPSPPPP